MLFRSTIEDYALYGCWNLAGINFKGNAPGLGAGALGTAGNYDPATAFYLPGTSGWSSTFGGLPTALWFLPNPLILDNCTSFGVRTNAFGFIISWATNISVVVEACTNLANHTWSPVATNTLTGGWSYFSDPRWTNYHSRFYRLRTANLNVTLPPVILSALRVTGGRTNFTFVLSGPAGSNYVLLVSTNLSYWSPVSTSTIPVSGTITVTNATSGYSRRFYQVCLK